MSFERKDERQPSKKKFKIRETTRFCKGNDAYRGEIFGGQQPVRHGEINSGGLDTFLFRFFFYHDHTKRCCYRSIVVVVLIVFFQRSDGKISTRLTATVRLLLLKCFLLLRRRSSPTGGKRRRDRKRERKRTHQCLFKACSDQRRSMIEKAVCCCEAGLFGRESFWST